MVTRCGNLYIRSRSAFWGRLIEKDITTPEYYPLTVNSLQNACNQKSSRDPVVQYDEQTVEQALETA